MARKPCVKKPSNVSNAADRSSKIRTENWPLESAVCTGHWWDWKNRLETSTNLEKMKSDSKQLFANITVGCRRYRIYWTAKLKRSWEHWISVLVRRWNKYKPGEIIEGSYAKHLGQTGCRSHIKWILLSINHKKKKWYCIWEKTLNKPSGKREDSAYC